MMADTTEHEHERPAPDMHPAELVDREALSRAVNELRASEARVQRNAGRIYDDVRSKLVGELLPVLDNLDRTLRAVDAGTPAPLVEGVRMVRVQLETVLMRYGVERLDAKGQRFDPAIHEAVYATRVKDGRHVGMVLEQLEAGYRFGTQLLRAARVTVGTR
jgi:molecular chaperone GrpE